MVTATQWVPRYPAVPFQSHGRLQFFEILAEFILYCSTGASCRGASF